MNLCLCFGMRMTKISKSNSESEYEKGLVHAYEKLHRLGFVNYSVPEKVYFIRYENGAVIYLQYVDRSLYIDDEQDF